MAQKFGKKPQKFVKNNKKQGQQQKSQHIAAKIDADIQKLKQEYEALNEANKEQFKRFTDFPFSQKTLKGLAERYRK